MVGDGPAFQKVVGGDFDQLNRINAGRHCCGFSINEPPGCHYLSFLEVQAMLVCA